MGHRLLIKRVGTIPSESVQTRQTTIKTPISGEIAGILICYHALDCRFHGQRRRAFVASARRSRHYRCSMHAYRYAPNLLYVECGARGVRNRRVPCPLRKILIVNVGYGHTIRSGRSAWADAEPRPWGLRASRTSRYLKTPPSVQKTDSTHSGWPTTVATNTRTHKVARAPAFHVPGQWPLRVATE